MSHRSKSMHINPNRKGWDGVVMATRARLENFFLSDLSSAEQAAWFSQMGGDPPWDAQGHRFIYGSKTHKTTVSVSLQTQFAWQWIFGVMHFAMTPTRLPTTDPNPTLTIMGINYSPSLLQLLLDCNVDVSLVPGVIVYGTPTPTVGTIASSNSKRCFAKFVPRVFPEWWDVTAAYAETFTTWRGQAVFVAAWAVNTRGGLQPLTASQFIPAA